MIELRGITVTLGRFHLKEISLLISEGNYGVLMGSSGSGKTTLLEILCGLRCQSEGRVLIHGVDHSNSPPGRRGIGYVPQDGALFPTMNVFENLGFAPKVQKLSPAGRREKVGQMAESLGIAHLLDRHASFLSGGEKQRVALGRALLAEPRVLCLDEPLAALDETTHDRMIALLRTAHRESGTTVLHITHRMSEARELGNQLFVLENGRLVDLSPPQTGNNSHNP